jgi:hypothetical protein
MATGALALYLKLALTALLLACAYFALRGPATKSEIGMAASQRGYAAAVALTIILLLWILPLLW